MMALSAQLLSVKGVNLNAVHVMEPGKSIQALSGHILAVHALKL